MSTTATQPAPAQNAGTVAKLDYKKPTNAAGLQRLSEPLIPQIKAALPRFLAGNADRMIRALLTECQKTPKLLDCTPISLLGGVIQVSQLGLELGGPTGHSYLIPFKQSAQLVIGYKGFVTLAHRSNQVQRITPRVVREGDAFSVSYGTKQEIIHRPNMEQAGAGIGYYAVVELANGGVDFEYMTVAQAQAHRDRYALSKSGPWSTNFDEMAMKTCIRRLAKRLPLSVEWNTAAGLDEAAESGVDQNLAVIVGTGSVDLAESLASRLDDAKNGANDDGSPIETPLQRHAKAIEEAESPAALDLAYAAAFDDDDLSTSDRVKISNLRDERKKALATGGTEQVDVIKG